MSSPDGAHLGYDAEQALRAVLSGEQTDPADTMTAGEMRVWLLSANADHAMDDYGECARFAGKLVLNWFLTYPEQTQTDPYQAMKDSGIPLSNLGLTGFQWGWAVNAARRCLELEPIPNPAILTIEVED
jgi:hypothetical protein